MRAMNDRWFLTLLVALFGAMALGAFLSGDPVFALPVVLVALIAIAFFLFQRMLANRALARHGGDPIAVNEDETDPYPSTNAIMDDHTAVGDTPEAHDELSVHDLPPGSPLRRAIEERIAREGGTTTRGDVDPSEPGRSIQGRDPGASRQEGYAEGEEVSAREGKQAAGPRLED
jgi:hypothetical protein